MEQIPRGATQHARAEAVRVGVDLAKRVIQVHAMDAAGHVLGSRALVRDKFIAWCAQLPAGCIVAMETSSSSHHWARAPSPRNSSAPIASKAPKLRRARIRAVLCARRRRPSPHRRTRSRGPQPTRPSVEWQSVLCLGIAFIHVNTSGKTNTNMAWQ